MAPLRRRRLNRHLRRRLFRDHFMSLSLQEKELLCTLHWFTLWSTDQRSRFLNLLVSKAVPVVTENQLADDVEALSFSQSHDTFRCQLKLFSSWFDNWMDKQRNALLRRLSEIDSSFVERFDQQVHVVSTS